MSDVLEISVFKLIIFCSYTIFLSLDTFENVNTDYSHCPYLDYTPSPPGPNDYDILVVEKEKFDQNIPRTQEKNLSCVAMLVGHMCDDVDSTPSHILMVPPWRYFCPLLCYVRILTNTPCLSVSSQPNTKLF